jgi:EF-P beta-lysylation protein EpmB
MPIFSKDSPPTPAKQAGTHPAPTEETRQAARLYPRRIPSAWAGRIRWADPLDPLGRQVIPAAEELLPVAGFTTDPLEEQGKQQAPGLLQKYAGRALLQLSGQCPIHCRFCFRRHDTYANLPKNSAEWSPALAWLAKEPTIHEVIYSGGDPLMRSDRELAELTRRLATIPHITRLRIHSRMPIVTPKRVGQALLNWLTATRLTPVLVLHCNHPAELDNAALQAIRQLRQAGILLLNQSVLLKGVNDDAETLAELCETLSNHQVIPYYLHLLDPVAGAAHFYVESGHARRLLNQLQARLPGYAVPKLVWEEPGYPSKKSVDLIPGSAGVPPATTTGK